MQVHPGIDPFEEIILKIKVNNKIAFEFIKNEKETKLNSNTIIK